jgi:hypothetical protein
MPKHAIIEIDGVLFDNSHREVQDGDWDDYWSLSAADRPIEALATLTNALSAMKVPIVAITARPEKWRSLTMQILLAARIQCDELIMRPDTDYGPAPEVKLRLAEARFGIHDAALKDNVLLAIDQDERTLALYAAHGVPTLHVRQP